METLISVCIGLGLAAACGFRVFVPFLVISIAAHTGHISLAAKFAWMGSDTALIAFAIATALEIGGYYVPWLDHFLDTVASPAAAVAGVVVSAAVFTNMDPLLQWSLAIIAGGGAAGVVQAGTVLTRAASTSVSGGLTNPIVATGELTLSVIGSILAIVVPLVAAFLVLLMASAVGFFAWRRWQRRKASGALAA